MIDPATITAIAGVAAVVGSLLTKGIDMLAQRYRDKHGVTLDERRLLSEDERAFRATILDQLASQRAEVAALQVDLAECQRKHRACEVRLDEVERQLASMQGSGKVA